MKYLATSIKRTDKTEAGEAATPNGKHEARKCGRGVRFVVQMLSFVPHTKEAVTQDPCRVVFYACLIANVPYVRRDQLYASRDYGLHVS